MCSTWTQHDGADGYGLRLLPGRAALHVRSSLAVVLQAVTDHLLINLVFHVIHDNGNGKPPTSWIDAQINVMNEAFSGSTDSAGTDAR